MERRACTNLIAALAATVTLVACSDQSPVAPDATPLGARVAVQAEAGSYAIFFLKETRTGLIAAADSEAVGTYLVLRSEVRDAAGNLAQTGSVTYEYCWLAGNYAPSASCDSGSGSWRRLMSIRVDPIGSRVGFGSCSTPRTIGFRVSYSGKGSGISSGVSQSRDFTWVAAE